MKGAITMTKIEAIKTLTANGIFELTQEILETIKSDETESHIANRDIFNMINSVHHMKDWTQFSWKEMVDLVAQAYGFTKFAAYNGIDVSADVADQIDELHTILWNSFSNMEVWNG